MLMYSPNHGTLRLPSDDDDDDDDNVLETHVDSYFLDYEVLAIIPIMPFKYNGTR